MIGDMKAFVTNALGNMLHYLFLDPNILTSIGNHLKTRHVKLRRNTISLLKGISNRFVLHIGKIHLEIFCGGLSILKPSQYAKRELEFGQLLLSNNQPSSPSPVRPMRTAGMHWGPVSLMDKDGNHYSHNTDGHSKRPVDSVTKFSVELSEHMHKSYISKCDSSFCKYHG